MTLCPIALLATCNKCPAVGFCPLKEVIGDHKPEDHQVATDELPEKDKSTH